MENLYIAVDSNSKLGKEFIPQDPKEQSKNGMLLGNVIKKHSLLVGNALPQCKGRITRRRKTINTIEESIIDLILISLDLEKYMMKIAIDDERKHVLSRASTDKDGKVTIKESDHNVTVGSIILKAEKIMKMLKE